MNTIYYLVSTRQFGFTRKRDEKKPPLETALEIYKNQQSKISASE